MDPNPTEQKREAGFVRAATRVFESVGLLNKGSADSPATPSAEQDASTSGINTNTLNATRVTGLGATITAVGAAALALFNVDKTTDSQLIVLAAYISVGAIVAAALLAVAIIVNADIRSRLAASTATVQVAMSTGDAKQYIADWQQSLANLSAILERQQRGAGDARDAWLDAVAASGITSRLKPTEGQYSLDERLRAGQSRILSNFKTLLDEADATKRKGLFDETRTILDSLERSLQG